MGPPWQYSNSSGRGRWEGGKVGSCASARPLLEHARRSPGLPSQTQSPKMGGDPNSGSWVLGAAVDHNGQPTADGQPSTARGCQTCCPAEVVTDVGYLQPGAASHASADEYDRQANWQTGRLADRQTVDAFLLLGLHSTRPSRTGSLPRTSLTERPAVGGSDEVVARTFARQQVRRAGLDSC